ncbi:MAG: hypothetical protein QOD98_4430, partial [Nocardioidaceae bacterium]|nr:hypothetical protein [Nocardioidaceae bacterium]
MAALLFPLTMQPVAAARGLASEILTPGPERYAVRTGPTGEVTVRARAPRVGLPLDWNR